MTEPNDHIALLVRELCELPTETEWVELKGNNCNPHDIGEYISALSNSATLVGQPFGYLLWGIDDSTHEITGTSFRPRTQRVGNEELENWLARLLTPVPVLEFIECTIDDQHVVVLKVGRASYRPIRFSGVEYIRIGSYKKKLADFPEKERALWRAFDQTPFEHLVAVDRLQADAVLRLLDYPAYFELLNLPLPETRDGILSALQQDRLIKKDTGGRWSITNLGAVLFARRMADFSAIRRKAFRVILYQGGDRVRTVREHMGTKGYAADFEALIKQISSLLPSNEVITQAFRRETTMYPELAIRELIANALIHQDFIVTGAGPMAEIFDDRIEISNPGSPLVETSRFLDNPPRSRNEAVASLVRRMGICEERGTGVDKVVSLTELYQLPAPIFEVVGENTRAVLFAHRPLSKMDKDDRIRACYLHACLKHVSKSFMTNTSLRERFGIDPKNSATASRLIKEALEVGVIKPHDETASRKFMRYVPFWA